MIFTPAATRSVAANWAAEEHVVRKDELGRLERAERLRIGLHVRVALGDREVLQQPSLEPFVLVEHEYRQQPVRKLRHHDARAAEVVTFRVPLLAHNRDVVAEVAPLARERARVDVRARPAEQVAVPDDDPHRR